MSLKANCVLKRVMLSAALVLLPLLSDAHASSANKPSQEVKVDIVVNVHNSEIGVSQETLDDMVEKLLEEAGFQVEESAADSATVQLKIDIYREDNGKFKIVGDLDEPGDDEEEEDEERLTEEQDEIDDLVRAIIQEFIARLRQG